MMLIWLTAGIQEPCKIDDPSAVQAQHSDWVSCVMECLNRNFTLATGFMDTEGGVYCQCHNYYLEDCEKSENHETGFFGSGHVTGKQPAPDSRHNSVIFAGKNVIGYLAFYSTSICGTKARTHSCGVDPQYLTWYS